MKSFILASLLLAAPAISALRLPHEITPRAASPAPEDAAESPISEEEFYRLYDIVDELIQAGDNIGLSALNFLTGDALGDSEANGEEAGGEDAPVVAKRVDNRPPDVQLRRFGSVIGRG